MNSNAEVPGKLHLIGVGGGTSNLAVLRWLGKVPLAVVAPWLVKAPLVVGLLVKGTSLLLRGSISEHGSTFVPTSFFEHKPDVPSPEDKVEEPKDLERREEYSFLSYLILIYLFPVSNLPLRCWVRTSVLPAESRTCWSGTCRQRWGAVPHLDQ